MKRKRLLGLVLVLLVGSVLFVVLDKPPALPAVMILPPGPLAVKSGRVPDRWIPAKWGWLRRACGSVLGYPRQVTCNVQFIETSANVASILAGNQPQVESNGVAIWFLPDGKLRPLQGAAKILNAARVTSEEQRMASVAVVDKTESHSADLFSRLGKETIDLSTRLIVTTNGQTNFVEGIRAQLPYGHALFVLDVRQPKAATNHMGFVITADEIDPAGNIVQKKGGGK